MYELGLTGVPIYNVGLSAVACPNGFKVNNNCATGSTALFLIEQLVRNGTINCGLALGFEKMERGSLGTKVLCRLFAFGCSCKAV